MSHPHNSGHKGSSLEKAAAFCVVAALVAGIYLAAQYHRNYLAFAGVALLLLLVVLSLIKRWLPDFVLGATLVTGFAAVLTAALNNREAVENFAKAFLKLTASDLIMIPVGSLLFFIFWRILDRTLFKPYLQLIEERESATTGALESAKQMLRQAELITKEFDDKLMEARIEATREKLVLLAEAKRRAADIVRNAQVEASQYLEKTRSVLANETGALRESVLQDVDNLAGLLVEKLKEPPADFRQ